MTITVEGHQLRLLAELIPWSHD
ncbi:hypothetical protein SPHINGOR109_10988 [Sphingorhabdus sp. 109]|nr:hypothetical protein SPHINGOR109_10988 [Sphingorhabdus sp. 109]